MGIIRGNIPGNYFLSPWGYSQEYSHSDTTLIDTNFNIEFFQREQENGHAKWRFDHQKYHYS